MALGWIKGHPARWSTFVANRVTEVQRLLPGARWRHVASELNPADCASRDIAPEDLSGHPLWWRGPAFLTGETASWNAEDLDEAALPEQRRAVHLADTPRENELLARFSS